VPADRCLCLAIGSVPTTASSTASKPRTPQTNGMIERFNGRIADVLATIRFDSTEHLTDTIKCYVQVL